MKRVLFFLAVSIFLASWSGAACSQELVVFTNDTAMSIKSHSEKGGYIYLTLQEGQIAVPKERVKEIRKSNASRGTASEAQPSPRPRQEPAVQASVNTDAKGGFRKPMGRPSGLRTPVADDDDDDEDDEAEGDDDDDGDDAEEENPAPRRMKDPSGMQPARPMAPDRSVKPVGNSPMIRKH